MAASQSAAGAAGGISGVKAQEQIAGGALLLPVMQGVTLGGIQSSTAVPRLCLVRDRGNGINHGYGITWSAMMHVRTLVFCR